jgi:hypothetical protein
MNRKLADLFMKGMTGNDEQADQTLQSANAGGRCFFESGMAATNSYNRSPNQDLYWRNRKDNSGQCQLWHWLPSLGNDRRRASATRQEEAGLQRSS